MSPRLALALERLVDLPAEGRIGAFWPTRAHDLGELPADRTDVIQPFRPDHDHFVRLGFAASPEVSGRYAMSVVFLPRAKAAARGLLGAASRATTGALLVDGQKTDGVDSLLREIRKVAEVGEVIAKAHGKAFAVNGDLSCWGDTGATPIEGGFLTRPGVFSADGPDPGSVLLAEALPARLGPRVADLGAGWGYLARAVFERDGVTHLDLVEADHVALACARENVTDPRATFHWADATTWRPEAPLDTVVMNPPFHQGRRAESDLGRAFIRAAAAMLAPRGSLWLVANRHLPYEADLRSAFREVTELGAHPGYKIMHAALPLKQR